MTNLDPKKINTPETNMTNIDPEKINAPETIELKDEELEQVAGGAIHVKS